MITRRRPGGTEQPSVTASLVPLRRFLREHTILMLLSGRTWLKERGLARLEFRCGSRTGEPSFGGMNEALGIMASQQVLAARQWNRSLLNSH